MGVDVAWVDADHKPLQQVFDPKQNLTRLASSRWPTLSGTVCLRFIDPFGDAVFNQAQIPELVRELRQEILVVSDAQTRAHLETVVRLIEKSISKVHTYIKFIGD